MPKKNKTKSKSLKTKAEIKTVNMDKVRIKRIKRNKKKATAAEKIMAGVGVGSTLLGGASVVAPQPNRTQFTRVNQKQEGQKTSKVKDLLKKVFGATLGAQKAEAASGPVFLYNMPDGGVEYRGSDGVIHIAYPGDTITDDGVQYTVSASGSFSEVGSSSQTATAVAATTVAAAPAASTGTSGVSTGLGGSSSLPSQQLVATQQTTDFGGGDVRTYNEVTVGGQSYVLYNGTYYVNGSPISASSLDPAVTAALQAVPASASGSGASSVATGGGSASSLSSGSSSSSTTTSSGSASSSGSGQDTNPGVSTPPINPGSRLVTEGNESASSVTISTSGLTTSPDINNSLKGTITVNGQQVTLNVMPDGSIWDTSGQNVTNNFSDADASAIRNAFASAPSSYVSPGQSPITTGSFSGASDSGRGSETTGNFSAPTTVTAQTASSTAYDGTVTSDNMNQIHDQLVNLLSSSSAPSSIDGNSVTAYMFGSTSSGTSVSFGSNTYKYDGSNWILQTAVTPSSPITTGSFNQSQAVHQEGESSRTVNGAAYIWHLTGSDPSQAGSWTELVQSGQRVQNGNGLFYIAGISGSQNTWTLDSNQSGASGVSYTVINQNYGTNYSAGTFSYVGGAWTADSQSPVSAARVDTTGGRSVHQTSADGGKTWKDAPQEGDFDFTTIGSAQIKVTFYNSAWTTVDYQEIDGANLNNGGKGVIYVSVHQNGTAGWVLKDGQKKTGSELNTAYSVSSYTDSILYESSGNRWVSVSTTASSGSLSISADNLNKIANTPWNQLSGSDLQTLTNYFSGGQNADKIPSSFSSSSFFAYALSLGGSSQNANTVINGKTYTFDGSNWVAVQAAATKTLGGTDISQMPSSGTNATGMSNQNGQIVVWDSSLNSGKGGWRDPQFNDKFTDGAGKMYTYSGTAWVQVGGFDVSSPVSGTVYAANYEQGNVRITKDSSGNYQIQILTTSAAINPQTNQPQSTLVLTARSIDYLITAVKNAQKINNTGNFTDTFNNALNDLNQFAVQEQSGQIKYTFQSTDNNNVYFPTAATAQQVAAALTQAGFSGVGIVNVGDSNNPQYVLTFSGSSYRPEVGLIANTIQTEGLSAAVNSIKTGLAEAGGNYSTYYVSSVGDTTPQVTKNSDGSFTVRVGSTVIVASSMSDYNQQILRYKTSDSELYSQLSGASSYIESSIASIASGSVVTQTGAAGFSFTTSSGSGQSAKVGDSWQIKITGAAANQPVYLTLKNAAGNVIGQSQVGTTDANGNFTLTSSSSGQTPFVAADAGNWFESWSVGSASNVVGTANFTVVASSASATGWMSNPTENNLTTGETISLNPQEFATLDTATYYANLLGGTVISITNTSGPFTFNQPQYVIVVNGVQLNAGLVAQTFQTYGSVTAMNMIQAQLHPASTVSISSSSSGTSVATGLASSTATATTNASSSTAGSGSSAATTNGSAAGSGSSSSSTATATAGTSNAAGSGSTSGTTSVSYQALSSGTVGVAYIQNFNNYSYANPSWSINSGSLPPGLNLDPNSGAITGVPTAAGTYVFSLQVKSGSTVMGTGNFSITVSQGSSSSGSVSGTATGSATGSSAGSSTGSATGSDSGSTGGSSTVSARALTGGTVGAAYSQALSAGTMTNPVWSVTSGSLPPGLSINASTGTISGTPTQSGTYMFTLKASSGTISASGVFSITISAAPLTTNTNLNAAQDLAVKITSYAVFDASGNVSGSLVPGYTVQITGQGLSAYSSFSLVGSNGAVVEISKAVISDSKITLTVPYSSQLSGYQVKVSLISAKTGVVSGLLPTAYSYSTGESDSEAAENEDVNGTEVAETDETAAFSSSVNSSSNSSSTDDVETADIENAGTETADTETADVSSSGSSSGDSEQADIESGEQTEVDGTSSSQTSASLSNGVLSGQSYSNDTETADVSSSSVSSSSASSSSNSANTGNNLSNIGGTVKNYVTTASVIDASLATGLKMPGYSQTGTANTDRPTGLAMPAGYAASGGSAQGLNPNHFTVGNSGSSSQGLQMPGQSDNQASAGQAGNAYVVKKGDTLWSIAKKYYGDGKQWRKILAANPKALARSGNTKTLKIGTSLAIPELGSSSAIGIQTVKSVSASAKIGGTAVKKTVSGSGNVAASSNSQAASSGDNSAGGQTAQSDQEVSDIES